MAPPMSPPQTISHEDIGPSPIQSLHTPAASTGQTPRFHTWPGVDDRTYGNDLEPPSVDGKIHEQQIETVKEILNGLKYMSELDRFVREHYESSQTCIIPAPLAIQLLLSVKIVYWSLNSSPHAPDDSSKAINQIAEDVLRSTKSNIDIDPTMDYRAFAPLVSGANLRVETLGVLYSIAARSYIYRVKGVEWNSDFMQTMLRCSNLSLSLARDVTSRVNDMLCSLASENMSLLSLLDGDASKQPSLALDISWD